MDYSLKSRTKKCMKIAISIKFSTEELIVLENLLKTFYDINSTIEQFDIGYTISGAIHECITTGYCYETYNEDEICDEGMTSDTRSVPLTLLQYLFINFKRVFFFIACVPIDRVPIYINDPLLEPFVKWRLTISK